MTRALDQMKKSVNEHGNDEVIVEFLKELIDKEDEGVWGFKDTYMKKIDKYLNKWNGSNED